MDKAQLHAFIAREQPNICQIAAYRDGVPVYADEWNGYRDTDCTHIMSATKSIMALLFGIAACQKPKQFRPPAIAAAISGKRIRQPIHLPSCTLTGM